MKQHEFIFEDDDGGLVVFSIWAEKRESIERRLNHGGAVLSTASGFWYVESDVAKKLSPDGAQAYRETGVSAFYGVDVWRPSKERQGRFLGVMIAFLMIYGVIGFLSLFF